MPITEKSIKNLRPPKKGEIRNPKGRGKGTLNSKTVAIKWLAVLEKAKNPFKGNKPENMSQMDIIVLAQLAKARKGDVSAFNALLDRTEGRPLQKTEEVGNVAVFKVGYGPEKPV